MCKLIFKVILFLRFRDLFLAELKVKEKGFKRLGKLVLRLFLPLLVAFDSEKAACNFLSRLELQNQEVDLSSSFKNSCWFVDLFMMGFC